VQHILQPGIILRERYEILELVGQGGMGAVYKTSDLRLEGRICAVKEILPALAGNASSEEELAQITEQFRTEASVLARLDHPNLPKVSDYFSMGLREYLVMDFVEGKDLLEILQETGRSVQFLREQQVLIWAAQMLDALEYLHSRDPVVLHRDIKPGNIKITPRGNVKLVDFGLVKVLHTDDSQTVTVVQGRGTVAYTPLEQYGSDTGYTDARTDLYSFGATLYHLLSGQPPLDAKERFLRPGSLVSLSQINPDVSASCERAVFQAMAMHPNERPANVKEMRDMLFGSTLLTGPLSSAITTPSWEPSWQDIFQANRNLVGAVGFLLLIAVLISLF